jgi:transmembrane sensor
MVRPMEPNLKSDRRGGEPSAAVVRQAAAWLAHQESGDASEQDHRDLDAWRQADPAHALALDRMGGMRERWDGAPLVEREILRRLLSRPKRVGPRLLVGAIVVIGLGWMTSRLPIVQLQLADQKTLAGETRIVDLGDGSHVTLSTHSAANLDVGGDRRLVRLLRGEILAQVAKRDGAAFTVKSDDGTAVALGTAFTVRKDVGSTTVAVSQSHVRVCPALAGDEACVTLEPGQRARMTPRALERLPSVPKANIGAWAEGWLVVDDRPLVEVLDDLNAWRVDPVGFDPSALADLRVSGVFPLREPQKALANLTQLLPIALDRRDPTAVVIRRR